LSASAATDPPSCAGTNNGVFQVGFDFPATSYNGGNYSADVVLRTG
jgi:hypothetical protein